MKAIDKIAEIKKICDSPTDAEATVEIVKGVVYGTDWGAFPNFKPEEFVCKCGKCKFSKPENVMNMNPYLLVFLQYERKKTGKAVVITCGSRCKEYNDSLKDSVPDSQHLGEREDGEEGNNAGDFYIAGVTSTEAGRDNIIKDAKSFPKYKYAYHNKNGKFPNMGSACHAEFYR